MAAAQTYPGREIKDNIIRFGINLSLLLVFWGGMLRENYNADTVWHMMAEDADVLTNIEDGRYMIALFDYILWKVGLRTTTDLSITIFLAFLLFALAMLVIQNIFRRWEPKGQAEKIGFNFCLTLVFLNVLFAELLMFGECSIYFGLGYLLAAAGVKRFAGRKYISMLLLFCMAACTYQYTMIFASVLTVVYVCLDHEEILSMKAVKDEMIGIIACMGTGGINYLSIKILEKVGVISRFRKDAGIGSFQDKITDMAESFVGFNKNSMGVLPDLWIPLLFALGVAGLMFYSCIKEKTIKKLIFISIVFVGSILLLYVIPVVQEEFAFPPRMAFCFYLVQGMLAIMTYVTGNSKVRRVLSLGCIGYMLVQLLFCDFVVTNRFVSNALDEAYVNMMYQEILQYEEETGITVTSMAVVKDAYSPEHYEEVNYVSGQMNERVLGTATTSLIWHMTGRKFERVECSQEIYDRYFEGRDWDCLDLSQQMVIEGDVAYWCLF